MASSKDLAELIDRYAETEGLVEETALPRVMLVKSTRRTEPIHALQSAAVCIIASGRKRVMLGQDVFTYDPEQYLIASVDLPLVGEVIEATQEEPYLCFVLKLDPAMLASMLVEFGVQRGRSMRTGPALSLGKVSPELLDAAVRLMRLMETPSDIPALAPLAEREILYRLMRGGEAEKLGEIALADGRLGQVNRAIDWIKRNFREPFEMDAVCAEARMSQSALHAHFKSVTLMSPLQYQKQLRLQEARRLILTKSADAAGAGHAVGYDSPSQFSREYRRLFGAPPMRDGERLREQEMAAG